MLYPDQNPLTFNCQHKDLCSPKTLNTLCGDASSRALDGPFIFVDLMCVALFNLHKNQAKIQKRIVYNNLNLGFHSVKLKGGGVIEVLPLITVNRRE